MHPIDKHANVEYRHTALAREAERERLVAAGRRHHREEHDLHPTLDHHHPAAGVRGTVGRLLIGLGTAIAGSGPEADARRAA
jgi:hypothetical protein